MENLHEKRNNETNDEDYARFVEEKHNEQKNEQ